MPGAKMPADGAMRMAAAAHGHAGVVRELAARGADLDATHLESGSTAFHFACHANQVERCAAAPGWR